MNKFITYIFISVLLLFTLTSFALAQTPRTLQGAGKNTEVIAQDSGLDGIVDINSIIGKAINGFISLIGVVFLILMIYGGYLWMTARGNEQQVEKSRSLIIAAIVGIVIVIGAYAITYYVLNILLNT
ncbi:MAG: hypothetical protein Q8Q23_05110 [bacterium]|nr:hypothetical protein [bacterium]